MFFIGHYHNVLIPIEIKPCIIDKMFSMISAFRVYFPAKNACWLKMHDRATKKHRRRLMQEKFFGISSRKRK